METTKGQDFANRILAALRKRYVEQVAFAGIQLAYHTAGRECPPDSLKPYQEALNAKTATLWRLLWDAYREGLLLKSPGKAPMVSYDPNRHCDGRCWSARGMECVCKCGGAFHGMGEQAVRLAVGSPL